MELATIDWIIIVSFLLLSLGIGIALKGKAGGNLTNFFLGGRNLPWYIAGISMVATTFAADTPLAVSEMVAQNGISKNWLWWSFLTGGMLTTFFFANYWRRANILTEVELINIRYSGLEAKWLRGFKAVYLGVFMNGAIIAWVNLAFNTLLITFFDIPEDIVLWYTFGAMFIAVIYTSLSGLLGVAVTDTVQFVIAMTGTVILAWIVISSPEVGGIEHLKTQLPSRYFDFFPSVGGLGNGTHTLSLTIGAFLAYVAIQWWSSWYPGNEPGGGGYIAQRMMSTRNERDSVKATLLFQIAHYTLRPWPWILVGLAAVYLYTPDYSLHAPELTDSIIALKNEGVQLTGLATHLPEMTDPAVARDAAYIYNNRLGYVYAMQDFLPAGLKGMLLVAFLAAYLSTISTQLNMGAGFLVNDLYKPFVNKNASQKLLVSVSRIATLLLMLIGLYITTLINSISGVWEFIIEAGAGLGAVLILRWYWWRINAWSEIAAMVVPFIGYSIGAFYLAPALGDEFTANKGVFYFTVALTTVSWLAVTYLTKPVKKEKLAAFYRVVRPEGWWKPVVRENSLELPKPTLKLKTGAWLSAIVMTYSLLFAIGKWLLGFYTEAAVWSVVFLAGLAVLSYFMKKLPFDEL